MPHLVLLGDSIFDNAAYIPGGPDVQAQLRAALPADWRVTCGAADGATTAAVAGQLRDTPADATHLVVCVGGNDALAFIDLLRQPDRPLGRALTDLAAGRRLFWDDYRAMLSAVVDVGLPIAVCTMYDAVPGLSPAGAALLASFNDVVLREAARTGVPVVDLRLVCDDPADYVPSDPIEPSARGGAKIAAAVARVVTTHDFAAGRCVLYGRA